MSKLQLNRYWGNESESKPADNSNSLSDLLRKIEERRKNKRKATTVSVEKAPVISRPPSREEQQEPAPSKKPKLDPSLSAAAKNVTNTGGDNENFTIVKSLDFKKAQKVKRVLPSWLTKPSVVSADLKNLTLTINDIPQLDESLVSRLKRNKITHFFPVQSQLIPWLLKYHSRCKKFWARDVCVSAPTGSGKTLAFVLPVIQILRTRLVRRVRAVVVLPTKDLAFQVYNIFKQYSMGTDLKVICLGSATLDKERNKLIASDELSGYRSLIDIIVTTPGRLVEHLKYTTGFSLDHLRFLIVDEADHVMESTQNNWLSLLHTRIPPFSKTAAFCTLSTITNEPFRPQKLLFSATLSQDPEKLQQLGLFQPILFTSVVSSEESEDKQENPRGEFIGKFTTPNELSEYYSVCSLSAKPLSLYYLIKTNSWRRVLCFVDSVFNVHRLTKLLQRLNATDEESEGTLNIAEISSKLERNVHHDVLSRFSKGEIDILVTTDSLARGIDIANVKYVILYDAPKYPKNYIHRIGRTGRAGQEGTSLVLVTPEQAEDFNGILTTCGKNNVNEIKIDMTDLKNYEATYRTALETLKLEIRKEDENNMKIMKMEKSGKVVKIKNKKKRRKKRATAVTNK